ncbi:unnamed protein product [Orchesella dallaii]|uniref:C2H2-type domain-containing protein n=1 Tax=Orchesella dallaii TaxID=48710 RepID=A0ABP1PY76_9HEXA
MESKQTRLKITKMATTPWNRCFLCSVSLPKRKGSSDDQVSAKKLSTSSLPVWKNSGHKVLFQYLLNDFQVSSNLCRDLVAFVNSKEGIESASGDTLSLVHFCNLCDQFSKSIGDLHAKLEVIQMTIIDKVKQMKRVVINNSPVYGTKNLKIKEDLKAFEKSVDLEEKRVSESGCDATQMLKKRKLLELLRNFQTHVFEKGSSVNNYPLVYLEVFTGSRLITGTSISTSANSKNENQCPLIKEEPSDFAIGQDTPNQRCSSPDDLLEANSKISSDCEDDPDWTEELEMGEQDDQVDTSESTSFSRRSKRTRSKPQEDQRKTESCRLRKSSRTSQKIKKLEAGKVEDKEVKSTLQPVTLTEAQKIAAEMKLERNRAGAVDDKQRETLQTLDDVKDPPKISRGKISLPQKKYSCQECSYQCNKTPNMEQHLREHETPEKTLKCPDCNKEFSQKQYWDFHIYVYCGATTWKCDICHESLHGGKLREHYENFHDGKMFTCEFCDFCFGTYKEYLRHTGMNHPLSGITFYCPFCPPELSSKVYNRKDILSHLHEAHNQTDTGLMSSHERKHDPILTIYSCSSCEKTYSNKKDLKAHILYAHKKEGPHKCDICGEVFMRKEVVLSHKRQKHGLGKLKCELCPDREYNSSASLKKHMITIHHIGRKNNKMITCEICGKEFVSEYSLKIHKPVHLEVKNFTCEICGFATKSAVWLKKHKITQHDGVKRHACPHCGKKFRIPFHLKEHINTHTKEKPFQCETCGQAFNQRGALLVHRKKMHLYQSSRTDAADISSNNLKSKSSEATYL